MPRQIWQIASALGLGASVLSLTSLILQGFALGVSAPIGAMIEFYEALLHTLLGWAEGPLEQVADSVERLVGVQLHPSPEWKHVFVLVWLYFSTDARSSFLQGRSVTGATTLVIGFVVSIAAVVVSGGGGSATLADVLWAIGAPLAGFVMHAAIESALTTIFYREPDRSIAGSLRYYFMTEILSALLAGAVALAIAIATLPALGASWAAIAALGSFVFSRGTFWLLRGAYLGFTDRAEDETSLRRFLRSGSGQFGLLLFSVLCGAVLFVALNAGIG